MIQIDTIFFVYIYTMPKNQSRRQHNRRRNAVCSAGSSETTGLSVAIPIVAGAIVRYASPNPIAKEEQQKLLEPNTPEEQNVFEQRIFDEQLASIESAILGEQNTSTRSNTTASTELDMVEYLATIPIERSEQESTVVVDQVDAVPISTCPAPSAMRLGYIGDMRCIFS
jgi:hypothetical protein